MRKMKSEGDEKGGVEGEFRTTQTPFETFAVLTHIELKRVLNLKRERVKKLKEGEKSK